MQTATDRLAVDEHEAAELLGISVHTLRKDRTKARRIPFFKIGGSVRYSVDRIRAALAEYEHGGPQTVSRRVGR
ncbi:helix-turn-helix domain-containing protein [Rubrivivax albus]|uniref:DNA-binding protein n=1 Tax=Rubrivivax albus TaxID=2499835 RepID=A0A3S2TKE6_9BURK|nr:DNA-binding protein [Rubrivivax albus]